VKAAIGRDVPIQNARRVRSSRGCPECLPDGPEFCLDRRSNALRGDTRGIGLQAAAHFQDLEQILEGYLLHLCAHVRDQADMAVPLQLAESFPNRGATHMEPGGQIALPQVGARFQAPFEDGVPKVSVNLLALTTGRWRTSPGPPARKRYTNGIPWSILFSPFPSAGGSGPE
jgi:hypothetical protein